MVDKKLIMSDAQAPTDSSTDTASTNVLDFGVANANIGAGTPLWWVLEVHTTAGSSGNAATLTVTLQDSADDATFVTLLQTEAFAEASLTADALLMCVPIPAEHARYIRCLYDIGTEDLTAGKFNSYLTTCPPQVR